MSSACRSEESEQGVIGCILMDPDRVLSICTDLGITSDAFYDSAHQMLYRACVYLHEKGMPVDWITVTSQLRKYNALDQVGGIEYLKKLEDMAVTSAYAESYLQVVHDKWMLRRVETASALALDAVRLGDADPYDILSGCLDSFNKIATGRDASSKDAIAAEVVKDCDNARNGIMPGMMTPWYGFNEGTGGIPYGLVTVLAGRGGTRKSYIVNQIAVHAALQDKNPVP